VQCSANGNDVAASPGGVLGAAGPRLFERRGEIPVISRKCTFTHPCRWNDSASESKIRIHEATQTGFELMDFDEKCKSLVWSDQQILWLLAQPSAFCLQDSCEGSCRQTGHTQSFLCQFGNPVGHLALPAHACGPQCASLTGCLRESLPATCLSLPKPPFGACPEDFASFALFQHCRSRRDSPTRQVCDHPFQDR
jgi:hypothetical protein